MAGVRIYGFPISTWTRTARMTCIEKGIEHELVPIAYGSDEHGTLHPFRRIPIVEIDGLRLIETLAIASHLDEAFPGPALQPVGQLERARMRTWMGLCGDYLFRDVVRTVPRGREPSADERETARTALERAEGAVGDERFLVGEAVTLADLYLAPQLANCREKAPELLDGLPRLGAWFERIGERESFRLTTDAPS